MSLLIFDHVTRAFTSEFSDGSDLSDKSDLTKKSGSGERAILNGIDLSLGPEEIVAIVGRSGAGKTTLLYLAAGLGRPTRGRVLFAGRDLATLAPAELSRLHRREIGLVFQNNLSLSALPVWENAALALLLEGAPASRARKLADEMLERVGLAGVGKAATATLSGGQRRRLGMARAMLARPRLLLADEPTADLDEETAARIEGLLFGWLREERRAALIVTHAASIERAAARTLRLEGGRLHEVNGRGNGGE